MSMHAHPITPVRTYVTVWISLLILTLGTTYVASFDLGVFNNVAALGIAVFKGSLVILFFMGVRFNTPLTKVVVIAGFVWLLIMFSFGMSDYATRAWLGVPGR